MSKYVCICKLCVSMSSVGYSDVMPMNTMKKREKTLESAFKSVEARRRGPRTLTLCDLTSTK